MERSTNGNCTGFFSFAALAHEEDDRHVGFVDRRHQRGALSGSGIGFLLHPDRRPTPAAVPGPNVLRRRLALGLDGRSGYRGRIRSTEVPSGTTRATDDVAVATGRGVSRWTSGEVELRSARPHAGRRVLASRNWSQELQDAGGAVQLGDDRFRVLLEAVLAVGTGLSLPDVLQVIVEGACRLADARFGALGVIGSDGQLSAFVTAGIDAEARARIGDEPRGRGILGLLSTDPRPLMLRDLTEHPASVGFPPNHPPMRSFLGVPVWARESVFGNLYLCEKQGGDEFTDTDRALASTLAVAAGIAIENATLYAEHRRREEWLDAIAEISRDLLGGAQIDVVLQDIAVRAGSIARADAVRVMLLDDEHRGLEIVAAYGADAEETIGLAVPLEGTAAGDACRTGETQVVVDAGQDPRVFLPAIEALRPGPVVYAPCGGVEGLFGVLSVDNAKGGRQFDPLDIDVIGSFARQAGLAVELARSRGDRDRCPSARRP